MYVYEYVLAYAVHITKLLVVPFADQYSCKQIQFA